MGCSGDVLILEFDSTLGKWTQVGNQDEIRTSPSNQWGTSVLISGNGKRVFVKGSQLGRLFRYRKQKVDTPTELSWRPLGNFWEGGSKTDNDQGFPQSVSISRNGECIAAAFPDFLAEAHPVHGRRVAGKVEIRRITSSGKLVPYGNAIINSERGFRLGDHQGVSLSSNCEYVAIGSDDNEGSNKDGMVRVYKMNTDKMSWEQVGQNVWGHENSYRLYFGAGVSISDDGRKFVSCEQESRNLELETNGCRMYKWAGSRWKQIGQTLNDLGFSVEHELSGDGKVLVATAAGPEVHVYYLNESGATPTWELRDRLLSGEDPETKYGSTLSISGNGELVAVGEPNTKRGRVHVYQWNKEASTCKLLGEPIEGVLKYNACGTSISLSADDGLRIVVGCNQIVCEGNLNAVGCARKKMTLNERGFVMVLQYDRNQNKWTNLGSQQGLNPESRVRWGSTVAMSGNGNRVVVGSQEWDYTGRAQVYQLSSNSSATEDEEPCPSLTDPAAFATSDTVCRDSDKKVEGDDDSAMIRVGCEASKYIWRRWTSTTDKCESSTNEPLEIAIAIGCNSTIDQLVGIEPYHAVGEKPRAYIDATGAVDVGVIGTYTSNMHVNDGCGEKNKVERTVLVPYDITTRRPMGKVFVHPAPAKDSDFTCPSYLEKKAFKITQKHLFLKIQLKDCSGNTVTEALVKTGLEPKVNRILKFGGINNRDALEEIRIQNGAMRLAKSNGKWVFKVRNHQSELGVGCFVVEFKISLPGGGAVYAHSSFQIKK